MSVLLESEISTPHDSIIDHDVIVFSKNMCVQCDATKRKLDKMNVDYHDINVEDDADLRLTDQRYRTPHEFCTEVLRVKQAPVVLVRTSRMKSVDDATMSVFEGYTFWSGYQPDNLGNINCR